MFSINLFSWFILILLVILNFLTDCTIEEVCEIRFTPTTWIFCLSICETQDVVILL